MNHILFSLVLVGVISSLASADEANRMIKKCLFIGDSITLHAPNEKLGWKGNWGMAASSQDKDFVHQVHQYLCDIQKGNEPELLISGRDTGQAGRISNALNVIDELTAIQADLIVIQLGENEKAAEVTKENFLAKYDQLVALLRNTSPKALIVCTGVWTPKCDNPRKSLKEDFIKEVCDKYKCVFVDIVPVASRPENAAWADNRHSNYGVGWHPGDGGMRGYAEAIITAIKPYLFSQPEHVVPVESE